MKNKKRVNFPNAEFAILSQKNRDFSRFVIFFANFFHYLLPRSLPQKPPILHGFPIVIFYKKLEKNWISGAERLNLISDSESTRQKTCY